MRVGTSFSASVIIFLAVPAGASTVLFTQTPTNTNGFSITDFRLADDFVLSNASTITDLLFSYEAQSIDDLGAVSYAIYASNASALGTVLQSATIASGSVTRTGLSVLCPTCDNAAFSIAPLGLAAGAYWLEVHAGTSFTDTNGGLAVDWAAVNDNATFIARFNSSGTNPDTAVNSTGFNQFAFQVSGTTVPEPGTLALIAIGFSLFAVTSRRRAAGSAACHTTPNHKETL